MIDEQDDNVRQITTLPNLLGMTLDQITEAFDGGSSSGPPTEDALYDQILPFPTDDPKFALGWEAADLWRAVQEDPHHEAVIHGENLDLADAIAEKLHLRVSSQMALTEPSPWVVVAFAPRVQAVE